MPKINQSSKEAVQQGIFNYLVYRDPTIRQEKPETLLANNLWRQVKNVGPRRQKDIDKLLGIITNVDASHEKLRIDICHYLENMGKGFFGSSQLQDCIHEELRKIDSLELDRENLNFLQSIVNKDPKGNMKVLVTQIQELESELETAKKIHQSDQDQIKSLQSQISGLQISMRSHQEELAGTLEIIKKNQQSEKEQKIRMEALEKINTQSTANINQLLLLLKSKGIISNDEMKSEHPIQSSEQFKTSFFQQVPLPEKKGDVDEAHSMDSTRSLMSLSP